MNRRGCLIVVGAVSALLLLCCVLLFFVGIPRVQNGVVDTFSEAISTEVAQQIDDAPGTLEPGTYTISVSELQNQLSATIQNSDTSSTSDFLISVDPSGISVGFTSGSQDFGYSGMPVAEDGKVVIKDMEVDNSFLGWVMPADKMATLIENGLNDYFESRGLAVESIQLGDDEITITTVAAGS